MFVVVRRHGRWLKVDLPVRPNHSTGWVKTSAVSLSRTAYRLDVRLRSHRMTVWDGSHRVLGAKIGVGQAVTPTPSGRYFITDLLKPPHPNTVYGTFAFGLSAYSTVYTSFAGGDGQVGLHGTDDSSGIGTNVSHGCIRTYNRAITRLATTLPLGTPVTISRT